MLIVKHSEVYFASIRSNSSIRTISYKRLFVKRKKNDTVVKNESKIIISRCSTKAFTHMFV